MHEGKLQAPTVYTDLHFSGCGVFRCVPSEVQGPAVSASFCLLCVSAGKGEVRLGDAACVLAAGQGVVVYPGCTFSLVSDEFDPWAYFWLAVDGRSALDCMKALGFGAGEPFGCDGASLCALAGEAKQMGGPGLENEFLLQALLYRMFACLARGGAGMEGAAAPPDRESLHVRRAAEFIRTHYADGITVADVAKHVSLNRSYLSTLFQSVMGTSPQEYLSHYRLSRAEEHLMHSDASIATVARSCGYQDPQVFSKAFRQRYGLTPVKYRAAGREKG